MEPEVAYDILYVKRGDNILSLPERLFDLHNWACSESSQGAVRLVPHVRINYALVKQKDLKDRLATGAARFKPT